MVYGYIYKIVNLETNKVYIGQTTGKPDKRWKDHLKKLKTNTHHSCHLQNSFNKHGNVFSFHILNYATSKDALDKLEMDYIARYKSTDQKYGYNMLIGGGGVRHTPSMKKHKSILLTRNNPMRNPETAKKMGETLRNNGIVKGKNNPRYRHDVPDASYINFLYTDLLLTSGDIAKLYNTSKERINSRLKNYGSIPKNKPLQNTKGLCGLSRYNSMYKWVTDKEIIIEDYPGVSFDKRNNRWQVAFSINKKRRKFGSFLLKEDAVQECKRLRKIYNVEEYTPPNKGKDNPKYRVDIPDNSYLTFLYWDLLLTLNEISKLYNTNASTIHRRLQKHGTAIKSESLRNVKGLCRISRYNFIYREINDDPIIVEDYPGVSRHKSGRWTIAFSINKKQHKFGSFLLKEDAILECKRLRKKYGVYLR